MPELPLCYLVPTRLLPVSQWAVCASLDALAHRRIYRSARDFHFLPRCTLHAEYPRCAWLSRVSRRGGDPCGRATVPLSAGGHAPPPSPRPKGGGLLCRRPALRSLQVCLLVLLLIGV